jgi:hypothetical protein
LIEAGEHYEGGFDAADPWYPETIAGQRQFFIDLTSVLKALPNHLSMGLEYWDAAGVNLPKSGGGYTNGDGTTDATYVWNGLTLFDNADTSGSSQSSAPNYSAVLEAVDALGGRLDPTLTYKLVNVASGQVLETSSTGSTMALATAADSGVESPAEQWAIASNGDGTFQIANGNGSGGPTVLDGGGSTTAGSTVGAAASNSGSATQAWNILTTGGGTYAIVNKLSGFVLATAGGGIEQTAPTSANTDWITPVSQAQQWQLVPVYLTSGTVKTPPSFSLVGTPSSLSLSAGGSETLNLTLKPAGGYAGTIRMSCSTTLANVGCTFSPTSYTADGTDTVLTGTVAIAASGSAMLARPGYGAGNSLIRAAWIFPAAWLLVLWTPKRRGRKYGMYVPLLLLLLCVAGVTACSGAGSGSGSGGGGGTTPLNGTVTVTAAGSTGNVTQTITVNVTVQ